MHVGTDTRTRSAASDVELLQAIGMDLRSLYAEVLKQPLPHTIEAALTRMDETCRPARTCSLQAVV